MLWGLVVALNALGPRVCSWVGWKNVIVGSTIAIAGVFAYNHARRHYPYRPPAELPITHADASNMSK